MPSEPRRYLIGQVACFGDCLYATTVAKQIKHDHPESHVTWAVAAKYRSVLDNNPHIDAVWELPIHTRDITKAHWDAFETEANARLGRGEFDEVMYTQVIGPHIEVFRTTLRRAVLEISRLKYTVDFAPVMRLSDAEIANVTAFASRHRRKPPTSKSKFALRHYHLRTRRANSWNGSQPTRT